MKVIDYEEAMKCLDEVEDSEDKTYAKSLLEWAINKRTFEAVPLSVIEKIHTEVGALEWYGDDAFWDGVNAVTDIIDKAVKEIEHE